MNDNIRFNIKICLHVPSLLQLGKLVKLSYRWMVSDPDGQKSLRGFWNAFKTALSVVKTTSWYLLNWPVLSWNPRYPAAITIFMWLGSQGTIAARASGHSDQDSSSFDNFLLYRTQVQFPPRLTFNVGFTLVFDVMCVMFVVGRCCLNKWAVTGSFANPHAKRPGR